MVYILRGGVIGDALRGQLGNARIEFSPKGSLPWELTVGPVSVIPSVTIEDTNNIVAPARQILFTAQYFLSKTMTTTDKQQQQSSTCRRISGRENTRTLKKPQTTFQSATIYCLFESDIRDTTRND